MTQKQILRQRKAIEAKIKKIVLQASRLRGVVSKLYLQTSRLKNELTALQKQCAHSSRTSCYWAKATELPLGKVTAISRKFELCDDCGDFFFYK